MYPRRVSDDRTAAPTVKLHSSDDACAGAAAAYVCRTIALRAGSYAPGIQEYVFTPLIDRRFGRDIDGVQRWFEAHSADLFRLGYKLRARRIAYRTPAITDWVQAGEGFRGAVLGTDGSVFHPGFDERASHAVGLALDGIGVEAKKKKKAKKDANGLLVIDPWPGVDHQRDADGALEPAHRSRKYAALVIFWAGYS